MGQTVRTVVDGSFAAAYDTEMTISNVKLCHKSLEDVGL
jgi:hypothetical protein